MLFTPAKRTYDLFDDLFNDPFFSTSLDRANAYMMKTDIQDNGTEYLLDVELPGYKKADIRAELKDGYLTISATKDETKEKKGKKHKFIRKERFTASCKRSFYVGDNMKQEEIKASFENGVLKIRFPKESPKAIEETSDYIQIDG